MTLGRLILRGLWHYRRTHAGVLLGAAVACAVLTGALLVGDCVRGSLRGMALARLGQVQLALHAPGRFFRAALADDLGAAMGTRQAAVAPVLALSAAGGEGKTRANDVQVLGVTERFWTLGGAGADLTAALADDEVLLNDALARRLGAGAGDEVLLRIEQPSLLPRDAPMSGGQRASAGRRFRVRAVVGEGQLGRFDLRSGQIARYNAFLPLERLGRLAGQPGKANLLLVPAGRDGATDGQAAEAAQANRAFERAWTLEDAALHVEAVRDGAELRSDRVFLEASVARAAADVGRKLNLPAQGVLTYLVNEIRKGDKATPYSMGTAIGEIADSAAPAASRNDAMPNDAMTNQVPISQYSNQTGLVAPPNFSGPSGAFGGGRSAVQGPGPSGRSENTDFTDSKHTDSTDSDRSLLTSQEESVKSSSNQWNLCSTIVPASPTSQLGAPFNLKSVESSSNQWNLCSTTVPAGQTSPTRPTSQSAMGNGQWAIPDGQWAIIHPWLASDLDARAGDTIRLTYFVLGSGRRIEERSREFRVRAVLEEGSPLLDPGLMPRFPGIAESASCRDWKTDLPVDYGRVRPKDEEYWKAHRGTPKVIVSLEAGREMWGNRFGELTAVRFAGGDVRAVREAVLAGLRPAEMGLVFQDVRGVALAATAQADFAGLFLGFSFFLIGSALILTGLLFALGVQQRSAEMGTLLALGLGRGRVRRLLLGEAGAVAALAAVLGLGGGVLYTRALLGGLGTIWSGAIGGNRIEFHASGGTLGLALGVGVAAALATAALVVWRQGRKTAARLLAGDVEAKVAGPPSRAAPAAALLCAAGAAGLLAAFAGADGQAQAGAFFASGALLLAAGICGAWMILSRAGRRQAGQAGLSLVQLALRNGARRRGRSLAVVALLACGTFLVIAVGGNRHDPAAHAERKDSGTGGFAYYGQTAFGVPHDLSAGSNLPYGLRAADLAGATLVQMRLREGDDASCLNLSRSQTPRILGVRPGALKGRFGFARVEGTERGTDPWAALEGERDGAVPAAADEATITWAMGKSLGQTLTFMGEGGKPFEVRLVAALKGSILQGSLIISEANFLKHFPSQEGYRVFLLGTGEAAGSNDAMPNDAMTNQGPIPQYINESERMPPPNSGPIGTFGGGRAVVQSPIPAERSEITDSRSRDFTDSNSTGSDLSLLLSHEKSVESSSNQWNLCSTTVLAGQTSPTRPTSQSAMGNGQWAIPTDFTDSNSTDADLSLLLSHEKSVESSSNQWNLCSTTVLAGPTSPARPTSQSAMGNWQLAIGNGQWSRPEAVADRLAFALSEAGLEWGSARQRLATFSAVENTYLSIFQVLGGLGLLLGSAGLALVVLRNVLERRGELALLRAVGLDAATVRRLVVREHVALVACGLAAGAAAGVVAILPAALAGGGELPWLSLPLTLLALAGVALASTWLAAHLALRGPLLDALRNE